MREIITFTQDELVQMLEGGEVEMEEECLTTVNRHRGIQFVTLKKKTIFKMEEENDISKG